MWFTKKENKLAKLPKMTEIETNMYSVIESLITNPDSIIDINPSDFSYMISLHGNYFLLITDYGIKFSNHGFVVIRNFESKILDSYLDLIKLETIKRREARIDEIFKNECDLLKNIATRIKAEAAKLKK